MDPELGEATIAVTSSTTAGLKTLPITILDEFGNTHVSSVEIEVAATPADELAWDEAIIYFMLTDRFANGDPTNDNPNGEDYNTSHAESYHGGDFQGIIDNLDYLDELGVNTIWITPIVDNIDYNMMPSADGGQYGYHGYWAKDFTKIDEHLGSAEKFEELIDAAHDRGIKIMLDVVLNHAGYGMKEGDTSTVSNFPTPEEQAKFSGMFRTEFVNDNIKEELSGLPDFLTEVPEISAQIIQWYVDIIENTTTARGDKIDYFRVDTVSNVESQTWSEFKNEIAKVYPDHKMIGEYYGAGVNNQANMLRTGRMDSLLDFEFKQIAQNFINGDIAGVESALTSRNAQLDNTATLGQFLSSHDEDGFLLTRAGGDINKFKAAVALQLTAKGQPVIYYGEEIGLSGKTAGDMSQGEFSENRYDFDWSLVDENLPITEHYRKLLAIRGDYSLVFARGDRQQLAGANADGYSVFSRTYGNTVYVGINIDETMKTVSFATGLEPGTGLVDLYNNVDYVVDSEGNIEIDLPSTIDGGTAVLVAGETTPTDLENARAALETAIAEAEAVVAEDYTTDSYTALEAALRSAQTVLANPDSSLQELEAATDALNNAVAGLVPVEDVEPEPEELQLLEGHDQTWDGTSALEFLISSDLETFISVEVDGLVLAEDLYELSSGSTVISLTPEYLSTLEEGTYEIVFNTEIGSVGTTFEIVGETDSTTVAPTDETDPTTVGPTDETDPTTTSEGAGGTGEGSRGMILAISLIGVAVILIIILYLRRRRENES